MAEENNVLKTMTRQIMRNHRNFQITVFDSQGKIVLIVNELL